MSPARGSSCASSVYFRGGALSSLETTVLLTVDETMEALRKALQIPKTEATRLEDAVKAGAED